MECRRVKSKRGNVGDLIPLIVLVFVTGLTLIFFYYTYDKVQTPLTTALNSSWSGAGQVLENGKEAVSTFNGLFVFFLVGLIIFIIYSASQVNSTPMVLFLAFLFIVVSFFIAVVFANMHQDLILTNAELSTANAEMSNVNWIINQLPIIVIVVGFVIFVVLWKGRGGQDGI